MKTISSLPEMKAAVRAEKAAGRRIGFVPTMGFLHDGHLSLVRSSKASTGVTVVSIFVNPAQFGPREDLAKYPRSLERDLELLKREGVDYVFTPSAEAMYPAGYRTHVEVEGLQNKLCGRTRPGHFRGVCTVVLKLFHIVSPDTAYFGRKDAQQAMILRRMAADLDLDIQIEVRPIVREPDGLAMSSRNSYLNARERKAALVLSRALDAARRAVAGGERKARKLRTLLRKTVAAEARARLDYAEIVDPETLEPVEEVRDGTLVALAAWVGRARLIDNWIVDTKG